jgi:glutamate-1-semialdehyde 2,1-aminomutase
MTDFPQRDATPHDARRTENLWHRLEGVLAAGRWTPTQGVLRHEHGTYPLLAQRGMGGRLWDTSGTEYVDWVMGWGPVVLGYRHPRVEDAIREQLAEGPLLSLTHPLEIEVAEAIRAMVPCTEGVAFGKNGSDSLALAVRIARAHTGRELVLHHGYHGFHDWYMASIPQCKGIPEALRSTVQTLPFNDEAALASAFEQHSNQIAAVVLEPARDQEPNPGYLQFARNITRQHGSLLIFDEIITSFRLARGGAQERYGVIPDLAAVGKALANGMPLSALCGKAEFLWSIVNVGYGLTYRGETLSLAAAKAALQVIMEEPVTDRIGSTGEMLRSAFSSYASKHGVEAQMCGPSARMAIQVASHGKLTPLAQLSILIQEFLKHGVLSNGAFLPCYAHDSCDVERTAMAFDRGLEVLAAARSCGSLEGFLTTPGVAIKYGDEEQLR